MNRQDALTNGIRALQKRLNDLDMAARLNRSDPNTPARRKIIADREARYAEVVAAIAVLEGMRNEAIAVEGVES